MLYEQQWTQTRWRQTRWSIWSSSQTSSLNSELPLRLLSSWHTFDVSNHSFIAFWHTKHGALRVCIWRIICDLSLFKSEALFPPLELPSSCHLSSSIVKPSKSRFVIPFRRLKSAMHKHFCSLFVWVWQLAEQDTEHKIPFMGDPGDIEIDLEDPIKEQAKPQVVWEGQLLCIQFAFTVCCTFSSPPVARHGGLLFCFSRRCSDEWQLLSSLSYQVQVDQF